MITGFLSSVCISSFSYYLFLSSFISLYAVTIPLTSHRSLQRLNTLQIWREHDEIYSVLGCWRENERHRFNSPHLKIEYRRQARRRETPWNCRRGRFFRHHAAGLQGRGVLPLVDVAPCRRKPTYSREIPTFPLVPNRIARFNSASPPSPVPSARMVFPLPSILVGPRARIRKIVVNPLFPLLQDICRRSDTTYARLQNPPRNFYVRWMPTLLSIVYVPKVDDIILSRKYHIRHIIAERNKHHAR